MFLTSLLGPGACCCSFQFVPATNAEVTSQPSCPFCKAELTDETAGLQSGTPRERDQNCPCREHLKKSVCAARVAAEPLPHQDCQNLIVALFPLPFRLDSVSRNLAACHCHQKPPEMVPNPCLPHILRC